jgi:nucleoside-diphosphate-sugar epimerase
MVVMRLLLLGGTWFLGRAMIDVAGARGWQVTIFNRGRSGPDPVGVEVVHGDRASHDDLADLAGRGEWDAVVDTSGRVPCQVLGSARALAGRVGRYVFVSTVSVYRGWPVEPLTEGSPLLDAPADAGPDFGADDPRGYPTRYGFQKSGCERAVREVFGDRASVLRPGVILGPHEYVGRLPWWLQRISRGGQVLVPGSPSQGIQPVDVRDVAAFALCCAEDDAGATYNVTAPPGLATFESLVEACAAVTGAQAELVWLPDEELLRAGVRPWTELPLWQVYPGTWQVDASAARAAGLTCRPLADTVRDTWAWLRSGGSLVAHERRAEIGIDPVKESALLRAWREG